jgi:hypothetical protein
MIDRLIHFFIYHKIYLISGLILLCLLFIPTKEKISSGTKKILYLLMVIWLLSVALKFSTGNDVVDLFRNDTDFTSQEKGPAEIKGSPFNKYYSNDAGRKAKE